MIFAICLASLSLPIMASDKAAPSKDGRPKWGFLGDDADLLGTVKEADEAILACVYRIEFQHIQGPFAMVNLHVTVARTFKGRLKPNERIVIAFPIDTLPLDAEGRDKHLKALSDADLGNLRFCFIRRPEGVDKPYEAEWLEVPKFTSEMNDFMEAYHQRSNSK
ncbi:hypothetical protein [Prosthecobacter sp.]|uniref:hypothetical protein n=1 Tax=Prosthecobacter sp. TaxID=1965333 RepID=UPI0037852F4C